MRTIITLSYASLLLILFSACSKRQGDNPGSEDQELKSEMKFDREKWMKKEGTTYPFRDQMLNDVVYNDTIRTLTKNEVLELLGEPDRISEDHLYYLIAEKRIGVWPLHTKTMVIKLTENKGIEWIKIHK